MFWEKCSKNLEMSFNGAWTAQLEHIFEFQRLWIVSTWKIITFSSGMIWGWIRHRFKDNSTCFDEQISENSWRIISDFKVIFQFVTVVLPTGDKAKQGIFLVFLTFTGLYSSHWHSNVHDWWERVAWASRTHLHSPGVVWDNEIVH